MGRILVEARSDLNVKPTLDALADCCVRLGHEVVRWRGPLSGRIRQPRRLRDCDLAIVWNGIHHKYDRFVRKLRSRNVPIIFAELGWFPQKQTFQLDSMGVNAAASWVADSLGVCPPDEQLQPLPAPAGSVLVVLQDDEDTNIKRFSPWFANMFEFVRFLHENVAMPLRIRAHPSHQPDRNLVKWMDNNRKDVDWDRSRSLAAALQTSAAVACVNSSSAIEAMHQNVPVLCYGESVFRKPFAVHCLNSDAKETRRITEKIASGESEVYPVAIAALLSRIESQQWRIEQITNRLPALIDEHLVERELTPVQRWSRSFTRLVAGLQSPTKKAA